MPKKCLVTQGKVGLSFYDKLDVEWKKIGLAAPARRALINAKLIEISDLKKITEKHLMALLLSHCGIRCGMRVAKSVTLCAHPRKRSR